MANEKWNCNQICRWNDPSDGCIKPTYATCPMANTEPDASGWGQVNEKRLIDKDALIALCDSPHWCVWMSEIEDFPTVDAVHVEELERILSTTPGLELWDYQKRGIMSAVKRLCGKEKNDG